MSSIENGSRKTIQINPDFLKFTNGGKTRKKHASKPIKFKSDKPDTHAKTTKRKMLNYIRRKQEANYREMIQSASIPEKPLATHENVLPKTDFEQSLEFLESITKNPKNATLKHRPPLDFQSSSELYSTTGQNSVLHTPSILENILDENVAIHPPENVFDSIRPSVSGVEPILQLVPPQYGCLKGGKLPTYRNWRMQTQKHHGGLPPTLSPPTLPQGLPSSTLSPIIGGKRTLAQNREEMRKHFQKKREEKQRVAKAKPAGFQEKQRRIVRRSFRVGKSKVYPKVGVLVSNKTIRNTIQSKCQDLKQTPIEEVKKYLIKHGFIRVGSSTPNDVLRKMYESAKLMCGEIQNHNPDNLLYNYLNNGIDV